MNVPDAPTDFWLWNLLGNLFSFAVVVIPAGLVVRKLKANPENIAGELDMQD
jgi:hypothetical protein